MGKARAEAAAKDEEAKEQKRAEAEETVKAGDETVGEGGAAKMRKAAEAEEAEEARANETQHLQTFPDGFWVSIFPHDIPLHRCPLIHVRFLKPAPRFPHYKGLL